MILRKSSNDGPAYPAGALLAEYIAHMAPCYQHNHNWQSDERRCPMYLTEINQLDPSWPANDREAVDRLLRFRVLRNLKREFDKMGSDAYARMVAAFPSTGASTQPRRESRVAWRARHKVSKPMARASRLASGSTCNRRNKSS